MDNNVKTNITFLFVSAVIIVVCVSVAVVLLTLLTHTRDLQGKTLLVCSVQSEVSAYVELGDGVSYFSCDVGNNVKYRKFGDSLVFYKVNFLGVYYDVLSGKIITDDKQKGDGGDGLFVDFYDIKDNKIAYTYAGGANYDKKDVCKLYTATDFEMVEEDEPQGDIDAHNTMPNLSTIDEIALDFFKNVKVLLFLKNDTCIAVQNDNKQLGGNYHLFNDCLYIDFGETFSDGNKYIKMKVYENLPCVYSTASGSTYDEKWSNLEPPPYFESENIYLYWESQNSQNVVIR